MKHIPQPRQVKRANLRLSDENRKMVDLLYSQLGQRLEEGDEHRAAMSRSGDLVDDHTSAELGLTARLASRCPVVEVVPGLAQLLPQAASRCWHTGARRSSKGGS